MRSTILAILFGVLLAVAHAKHNAFAEDSADAFSRPRSRGWRIEATNKEAAASQSGLIGGLLNSVTGLLTNLLGGLTAPDDDPDAILLEWWEDYKETYNKSYSSSEAEKTAFSNFRNTLKRINNVNANNKIAYWSSANVFSDMDFDTDIRRLYLMQNDPTAGSQARTLQAQVTGNASVLGRRQLQGAPAPKSVDWRKKGKVNAPREQGQCGSCWAFAAASVMESAYYIVNNLDKNKNYVDLSEQQLVSCATSDAGYGSMGCGGGMADMAIQYATDFDLSLDRNYPYTSGQTQYAGYCDSSILSSDPVGQVVRLSKGPWYPKVYSEWALMAAVDQQPMVIYFDIVQSAMSYAGGIYRSNQCGGTVNHAMVVVGYVWTGKIDNSFWIIKNSWGTQWGVNGYFYVGFTGEGTAGMCDMYTSPVGPKLAGFSKKLSLS